MKRLRNPLLGHVLVVLLGILLSYTAPVSAQLEAAVLEQRPSLNDDCNDVRYLMQRGITPYDLGTNGGSLAPGQAAQGSLGATDFANFWAINVTNPSQLRLEFSQVGLDLEYAVFFGMEPLTDGYRPVENNLPTVNLPAAGFYTIAVARARIWDDSNVGSYSVTADFSGNGTIRFEEIRDEGQTGRTITPQYNGDGKQVLTGFLNSSNIRVELNAGGATQITSRPSATNYTIIFDGPRLALNNWAEKVALLGGNLSIQGTLDGQSRSFYLEDYRIGTAHDFGIPPYNWNPASPSGNPTVNMEWDSIEGVWLLRNCTGVKLRDGHTLVVPVEPDQRNLTSGVFEGDDCPSNRSLPPTFALKVNALNAEGTAVAHSLCLAWQGIKPATEVSWAAGVLRLELPPTVEAAHAANIVRLEADTIEFYPLEDGITSQITLADPNNETVEITLDWFEQWGFEYVEGNLNFYFDEAIHAQRPTVTRSAANVQSITAADQYIDIIYRDTGEQRRLLPKALGYVELITPAGAIENFFDVTDFPDQPTFAPRALNNVGAECYPINTLLPEANCPPNGYPNPANGNLWYAVTDHQAEGFLLDLSLTRSYNSLDAEQNSPFGRGWTSLYLLDYNIPFDAAQGSRPITNEAAYDYRVGLNLLWEPRNYVIFTTASGSQHVFRDTTDADSILTAITMPGWELQEIDRQWVLSQPDGLTYEFDAAGRLRRFGYPAFERWIAITYNFSSLNGTSDTVTGTDPETNCADLPNVIFITDAPALRRLELYFDQNQHVAVSILRDMTLGEPAVDLCQATLAVSQQVATENMDLGVDFGCEAAQNCYITRYGYDGDLLKQVLYADGGVASYDYEPDQDRLSSHNDPRAPIAPNMAYDYSAGVSITIEGDLWRATSTPSASVTVTDMHGGSSEYAYEQAAPDLFAAGEIFALTSYTSPLKGETPTAFEWSEGWLNSIRRSGRNTVDFDPTDDFLLAGISRDERGYPQVGIAETGGALTFNFEEQGVLILERDAEGRVTAVTDAQGKQYRYDWEANELIRLTVSDGASQVVTEYLDYDDAGLVLGLQKTFGDGSASQTITYTRDGVGRIRQVSDSVLGEFCLDYTPGASTCEVPPLPEVGDCTLVPATQQIILKDPLGTLHFSRFDARGQLVEEVAWLGESFRNWRQYGYDALRRMTSLKECVGEAWRETTYDYSPVTQLSALTNEPGGDIFGYQVRQTDPYGRSRTFIYDALDRVRHTEDIFGNVTRFTYTPTTTPTSGLLIRQFNYQQDVLIEEWQYIFAEKWQLKDVRQCTPHCDDENAQRKAWSLRLISNGSNLALTPQHVAFSDDAARGTDIVWGDYVAGRATNLTLNPSAGNGGRLAIVYDFEGNPQQVTQGEETYFNLICDGGLYQVRSTLLPSGADFNCDSTEDLAQALTFDPAGRLTRVQDEFGERTFSYAANPVDQTWDVSLETEEGYTWTLRYDALGKLVEWWDEFNNVRRYSYDALGRLVGVTLTDAGGNPQPEGSFSFEYNAADLLTKSENGVGQGFFYAYDSLGLLISEQDIATNSTISYIYDAIGRLISTISDTGRVTNYEYDALSRLTAVTDSAGGESTFDWNDANNRLEYTDPLGNRTTYEFNPLGQLENITDAEPRTYTLGYDSAGNLSTWQAVNGQNLTFGYADSQVTAREESAGWQWDATLSPLGQLEAILGESLVYDYDGLGRLTTLTTPENSWTLSRTPTPSTVTLNDPFGDTEGVVQFDALNRPVVDVYGNQYTYAYPDEAQYINLRVITPLGEERIYTFSPLNLEDLPEPTIIMRSPGKRVSYTYGEEGLLTQIAEEVCLDPLPEGTRLAHSSASAEDGLFPLAEFTVASPASACLDEAGAVWRTSTRFTYDSLGQLSRIIDAEQNVQVFNYDAAGNLSTYQNVNGETFSYDYDPLNRLQSLLDPYGNRLFLTYDRQDRVTAICLSEGANATTCPQANSLENYEYDALGRLTAQNFGENGSLTSDATTGLLTALNVGYSDSVLGIVASVGLDETTYDSFAQVYGLQGVFAALRYFPGADFNTADLGYRFDGTGYTVDLGRGDAVDFDLLPQGLLASLDYNGGVNYAFGYSPDDAQTTQIVTMTILEDDDYLLFLDRLRQAQTVFYGGGAFIFDHQNTPGGQLRSQQVIITRRTEAGVENVTYAIDVGYDRAGRPLTLRVTSSEGVLLYVLTLRYDEFGQLQSEKRQYSNDPANQGDNVQIDIAYGYSQLNLLTQRTVTISGAALPSAATSRTEPLLLGLGMVIALGMLWRRARWGQMVAVVLICALTVSQVTWAQDGDTGVLNEVIYQYSYDANGNLERVLVDGLECAAYAYDAANRLLEVRPATGETVSYQYDELHRLTGANNRRLVYNGHSPAPLYTEGAEGRVIYGQTADGITLFQAINGVATPLVFDGRGETRWIETEAESNVWLFDPLGRYVEFTAPQPTPEDQCTFLHPTPALSALSLTQPVFEGMLWDAATNLYFKAGRAYDPLLGRFLQRDFAGPDASGNLYGYTPQRSAPPAQRSTPDYVEGLQLLAQVEANRQRTQQFTASTIMAQYQPQPLGFQANAWDEALRHPSSHLGGQMTQLLDTPAWLLNNYNLPAARLDPLTGALRLVRDNAPGQGGWRDDDRLALDPLTTPQWSPIGISTADQLQGLVNQTSIPLWRYTTYLPYQWQPLSARLGDVWAAPVPQLRLEDTPAAAQGLFPIPLRDPEHAAQTLAWVQTAQSFAHKPGLDWAEEAIIGGLPTQPALPNPDPAAWVSQWFTDDTLGVKEALNRRWNLPQPLEVPLYRLGSN